MMEDKKIMTEKFNGEIKENKTNTEVSVKLPDSALSAKIEEFINQEKSLYGELGEYELSFKELVEELEELEDLAKRVEAVENLEPPFDAALDIRAGVLKDSPRRKLKHLLEDSLDEVAFMIVKGEFISLDHNNKKLDKYSDVRLFLAPLDKSDKDFSAQKIAQINDYVFDLLQENLPVESEVLSVNVLPKA